ncbi:hypothetical protein [Mucilaginibacter sp. UR6-11]|uniref:hypothetical protein n=1 Tax=Mucilaginibacter sp. UR6-11 TaxID=1435644 RepID=UPI001E2ACE0D|nr:hypothetical protein [Mucilaginibacter sp. UR6-11]MCC8425003.1 hypothetical protein [Mucilaginibacter sp. UR6-11]
MHFKISGIRLKAGVLLLTVSVFGCSKNTGGDIIKDPVIMTFDKLEPVSEMRVFTGRGMQLDPHLNSKTIQNYLDRNYSLKTKTGEIFYSSRFAEPDVSNGYGKTRFTFYDNGKIRYSAEIINVKVLGDTRILKSIVTNKIEDDPIIKSELFKYKFDTNLDGTYNYQYVVHGDNRSLDISLLYYKLVRYDDQGNLKSLAYGTVHNELNESFIQSLTQFDTLAVKAYRVKYSSK